MSVELEEGGKQELEPRRRLSKFNKVAAAADAPPVHTRVHLRRSAVRSSMRLSAWPSP